MAFGDLAGSDSSRTPADARAAREAHLDRAMAALRRAVAAGYRESRFLEADPDLEPLRRRPDFRLLLMDASLPDDPFAP